MNWTCAHAIVAIAVLSAAVWTGHQAATTVVGTPTRITACTEEDGSGPQSFPCWWNDGTGSSYMLTVSDVSL